MESFIKKITRHARLLTILTTVCALVSCDIRMNAQANRPDPSPKKSIKLAILLDTSNSMDGLIDQAKSQLWSIVNELAKAECDATKTELKIALYQYGNDNLPEPEGYIRMVTQLTTDLDQISEDLFSLKTCGGQEYCGQVINTALKELTWSSTSNDYQVIFIAGNEPFNQGSVSFKEACLEARKKGVIVNTIHCGDFNEGINTFWKTGADLTGGSYFSIEQNRKTVYIETPYDKQISDLNEKLNNTYVYYGKQGASKKEMQIRQDANAASYGRGNSVNRAISKSSKVYVNSSWDMVDAAKEKEFDVAKINKDDLPEEMQNMTVTERNSYIESKKSERVAVQKEIAALSIKRTEYLNTQAQSAEGMLDNALLTAIKKQATEKNFRFTESTTN